MSKTLHWRLFASDLARRKGGALRLPQEPKRRHSKARKRTRRASIKLTAISLVVCKNCGGKSRPHMACMECGYYSGKAVTKQKAIITKA